jgi:hypothetical protein
MLRATVIEILREERQVLYPLTVPSEVAATLSEQPNE